MGMIDQIPKDMPVKRKLVLLILAACVPSILICLISLSVLNIHFARNNLKADIQLITDLTVDHLAAPLAFHDKKRAQNILFSLKRNKAIQNACLYNAFDELMASYVSDGSRRRVCKHSVESDDSSLIVKNDIFQKREKIGYIEVVASFEQIRVLINYHILIVMFCLLLVVLFVSLPLATFLQKEISKPVYDILEASKKLYITQSNSGQITRTADELLLSLLILRNAESALKLHRYNLEKVDSLISNREILINALDEKAASNYKVREIINNLWESDPYQNLDQLYTYSTTISSDLDMELEELVEFFRMLHEKEKEILTKGKVTLSINSVMTELLSNFIDKKSINNVEIIFKNAENLEELSLYKLAFYDGVNSVLKLLLSTIDDNQQYELIIKYDKKGYGALLFDLKNISDSPNDSFDLDHADIDKLLIEAKYFANINNPSKDGLQITLDESVITIKLGF